jgi:arginine deiminase
MRGGGRVSVHSEVGRLRRVLVHEPGPEIDHMVPSMMEELLFDDILFGDRARDEHRRFRRVLQLLGVEVIEALDLLAEVLEQAEARRWIEDRVLPDLRPEVGEYLQGLSAREAAAVLVGGVRREADGEIHTLGDLYGIRPLPNWCFQRDTQVVLGDSVLFSSMATPARRREGLLSRAIFRFHPAVDSAGTLLRPEVDGADTDGPPGEGVPGAPSLEGGDVLVLSPDVIAVGASERTDEKAVEALVRALHRREGGPRWLFRVRLPRTRAFMHLDTLFTPVDRDAALVFAPVILEGSSSTARVAEVDLHADEPRTRDLDEPLLPALARRGVELTPILCGGDDPMQQRREQWTDGANALALAPGVAVLYDRNVRTAEAMEKVGFRVVHADDLLLGAEDVTLDGGERVCLLIPSNELSRARGGPHCLTHPLERDPADP